MYFWIANVEGSNEPVNWMTFQRKVREEGSEYVMALKGE
jgi:hypothetical protein